MPLRDPPINLGNFPDDPNLSQDAYYWIPDPSVYGPGPYPIICGTRAGGFQQFSLQPLGALFDDLVKSGFMCVAFQVRVMEGGLPGQTTDGKYHQQTDDFKKAVRAIRTDPRGIGWVAGMGGSGSGHHDLYCAIDGTAGDDRLDACITLSPPTDFSDREDDALRNHDFLNFTADYARTTVDDLPTLLAASPISLNLANACPIRHYNGTAEAMPYSNLTRFSAAMAGMTTYEAVTNSSDELKAQHAFAMWKLRGGGGIHDEATQWYKDRFAEWTDGGGTVDQTLNDYTYQIFGGTGTVSGGRISGASTSCQLTGLPTNLPPPPPNVDNMGFQLIANNQYGPGDPAFDSFTPLTRAGGGGTGSKRVPIGVTVFIPTTLGIFDGLEDLTFWTNRSIIGARLHTNWAAVEASQGTLDLTTINQFLQLCVTNQKRAIISISAGVGGLPDWAPPRMQTYTTVNSEQFPLPWDTDYISLFNNMLSMVGAQIDSNPQISAIVTGGTGSWADTAEGYIYSTAHPFTSDDVNALTQLALHAGYDSMLSAWEDGLKGILGGYNTSFPATQKVYDLNLFVPNGTDSAADAIQIAARSIQQVALMNELLTSTTDGSDPVNAAMSAARGSRGYKTLSGNFGDADAFQAVMTAGLALNPRFIEIWYQDAEDTDNASIIRDTAGSLRTINSQQGGL